MSVLAWVTAGVLAALGLAAHLWVLWRSPYLRLQMPTWGGLVLAGAAAAVPIELGRRALESWAQLDAGLGGQVTLLLYSFVVVAPLTMGAVVVAMVPFWRLRRARMRAGLSRTLETKEGVAFATSAALGFVVVRNFFYLADGERGWTSLVRTSLAVPTFMLLCGLWGYVLGRNASRGLGGRRFNASWMFATVFFAVCDQMLFHYGSLALAALTPVLGFMHIVAWVLWRDLHRMAGTPSSAMLSVFTSGPAPSLTAIRDAFVKQDSPLTLRWIAFGALVTIGMITTGVAVAVVVGWEVGLDFSAVDRPDAGAEAMAPLALLSSGVLAAFPGSGYLLARASNVTSVLEPAIAAALALVFLMVFMGMMAPVSVVFAIAFSPIAFGLSCVGAWVGLGE